MQGKWKRTNTHRPDAVHDSAELRQHRLRQRRHCSLVHFQLIKLENEVRSDIAE
jgi:hypothetical protein